MMLPETTLMMSNKLLKVFFSRRYSSTPVCLCVRQTQPGGVVEPTQDTLREEGSVTHLDAREDGGPGRPVEGKVVGVFAEHHEPVA